MLQQTQVATVIPYYNRWMQQCATLHNSMRVTHVCSPFLRFPTIRHLVRMYVSVLSAHTTSPPRTSLDGSSPPPPPQASSDIDTINAIWKGLGYYSRAARLLAGAKKAVEDFAGRLPYNAKDMESRIPGIGRYSAGAICSIAYNERVPVVSPPSPVPRLPSPVPALPAGTCFSHD